MNDLGRTLVWAAGQVTLVAAASAALYALAARRGAGALAAGAGLTACAAVTLLALCPLPATWGWEAPPAPPPAAAAADPGGDETPPAAAAPAAPGLAVPLGLLREARARLGRAAPDVGGGSQWPAAVAAALLAAAGLAAGRLLLGLWAVCRCVRRGRAVDDHDLLLEAETLQAALGCPRPVALWECDDLAAPATVGWRRPAVLLPAGWRAWGDAERRAVLAHELAHVRRADYAAWLAACAGAALHPYHPLVGWLAGRLRLEQEMAADALAAPHAGGRATYLRALANLVLRLDGPAPASPARPFLSSPGSLLRRIAMLRATEGSARRPLPRGARAAFVALLAAVALGVAAVRSPAQKGGDAPAAAKPAAPEAGGGALPAFDLTYLPRHAKSVVALRPAVLFAQPGMERIAREFDEASKEACKLFKVGDNPLPPVAEIEQLILLPELRTQKDAKKEQTALLFSLSSIRVTHDYDWAGHLKRALPELVEVRCGRGVYFKLTRGAMPLLVRDIMGNDLFAFAPDGRTLVLDSEENIRRRLEGLVPAPHANWFAAWERISRRPIAVAMDTRDKSWQDDRRKPEKDIPADYLALCRKADYFVAGIDPRGGRLTFDAVLGCTTAADAAEAVRHLRGVIDRELKEVDAELVSGKGKRPDPGETALCELGRKSVVRADGTAARWHSEVKIRLTDLVGSMVGADAETATVSGSKSKKP
jgi:hypothetical protein